MVEPVDVGGSSLPDGVKSNGKTGKKRVGGRLGTASEMTGVGMGQSQS